jgi:hypothetical protein
MGNHDLNRGALLPIEVDSALETLLVVIFSLVGAKAVHGRATLDTSGPTTNGS